MAPPFARFVAAVSRARRIAARHLAGGSAGGSAGALRAVLCFFFDFSAGFERIHNADLACVSWDIVRCRRHVRTTLVASRDVRP